ncbi:DUF5131 family protein [Mesorhizobium sp. M0058]|uniref:DUF5131 family protein n=1 Tax=Mesorhizobium sp. M0058 TaxID=2956865 RepID=UPI0033393117
MGETTAISWCDHTFNGWIGCMKVSPACDGCYAEALMDKRYGRVEWGAPGHGPGTRVRTSEANWKQPLKWNRKAQESGTRPFVFCSSLADVFDNHVDPGWRADLFDLIRATPNLVWLLLTKRPQNIVEMSTTGNPRWLGEAWPRNAAIGTTVEDQKRVDINVPALLNAKGELNPAFAFLSCEPLLGPLQIAEYLPNKLWNDLPSWTSPEIDWVITGGETDQGSHKARPTNPQWFRSLRDQCTTAGVAYHHKQNGEWVSVSEVAGPGTHFKFDDGRTVRRIGKGRSGRTIDGAEHDARPQVAV